MDWYFEVLQKYATFSGRARRKEYWMYTLVSTVVAIILAFIGGLMKAPAIDGVYQLAVLIPGIAVGVRRMHDVNKSGWYLIIPIYNLVLLCREGETGPNPYGPDPKQTAPAGAPAGPRHSMPPGYVNNVIQLEKFAELKSKGVITEQEFNEQKKKLLAS